MEQLVDGVANTAAVPFRSRRSHSDHARCGFEGTLRSREARVRCRPPSSCLPSASFSELWCGYGTCAGTLPAWPRSGDMAWVGLGWIRVTKRSTVRDEPSRVQSLEPVSVDETAQISGRWGPRFKSRAPTSSRIDLAD